MKTQIALKRERGTKRPTQDTSGDVKGEKRLREYRLRGVASALAVAFLTATGLLGCDSARALESATPAGSRVFIVNHTGADEFAFKPRTMTVRVGKRVVWINRSVQPHTVTAKGRHPAFNSGTIKLINPKHQFSFVFHRAGKYTYFCQVHPYMTGTVIVKP